ncbi:hypothetical protein ACLQ3K_20145 [Tsukamurella sp. DT100]|uniref:hypothetical protein n=1 Tax=Tsukamurella sp. DT100 TaxID=3393415 RepID=UPI003CEDCAA0
MTEDPKQMPRDVVIDRQAGEILIDGEPLPYLIAEEGPSITRMGDDVISGVDALVVVPIMVLASDLQIIAREGSQCIVREVDAESVGEEIGSAILRSVGIDGDLPKDAA